GLANQPAVCRNGQYIIAAIGGHSGTRTQSIGRMDVAGGSLKMLTDGRLDDSPVCAPDGKSVFYRDSANSGVLMSVPIEGGQAQKVSDLFVASNFDISPDGKLAAFATFEHVGEHENKLALVSLDTKSAPHVLEFQHAPSGPLHFTGDGKAVVY